MPARRAKSPRIAPIGTHVPFDVYVRLKELAKVRETLSNAVRSVIDDYARENGVDPEPFGEARPNFRQRDSVRAWSERLGLSQKVSTKRGLASFSVRVETTLTEPVFVFLCERALEVGTPPQLIVREVLTRWATGPKNTPKRAPKKLPSSAPRTAGTTRRGPARPR